MSGTDRYNWAKTEHGQRLHHLDHDDPSQTLCGREVWYLPLVAVREDGMPVGKRNRANCCKACLRRLEGQA